MTISAILSLTGLHGRAAWIATSVAVTLLLCGLVATLVLTANGAAAQQQYTIVPSSPALPLFRCDGQRPPMFGADQCANWRLMKKQEELIDLQLKELKRKAKKEKRSD